MLRKKKMRKLGLIAKPGKTREQQKYEQMVQEISDRVAKRRLNKQLKQKETQMWLAARAPYFVVTNNDVAESWAEGKTTKTSVFDASDFKNIDLEEVNARRLEAGITTPIEMAEKQAQEEIRRKATMVAPAYSKGNYVYLGNDKQAIKDAGKKTQQMD